MVQPRKIRSTGARTIWCSVIMRAGDDPRFDCSFADPRTALLHNIQERRGRILPPPRLVFGPKDLSRLGCELFIEVCVIYFYFLLSYFRDAAASNGFFNAKKELRELEQKKVNDSD